MNTWFFYFLKRSISQRRGRFIISSAAVMLTVTVVTALIALSAGVRDKIGGELKQYGANMIVTHASGDEIEEAVARSVSTGTPAVKGSAFQLYGTGQINGTAVELLGLEPDTMNSYRIQGTLPQAENELMAGVTVKDVLQLAPGAAVRFDNAKQLYTVTAVFERGSDEDSFLVMPLQAARRLTGRSGVSAILLNVDSRRLKEAEESIRASYPLLRVKTLRQVAVAEENILARIQLLMLLVTAVVLASSVIALGSTMGANVIERREEIGLMKSIGATQTDIRKFFMAETALSGFAGSLAGYGAGILAAESVSKTAFGSFIPVNPFIVIVSVMLGLFIAVSSTYFPVRDAMKIVPAEILRGE
jgi:putative ABC transport system permease protein